MPQPLVSVVSYLGADGSALAGNPNVAATRTTVPDHIGHSLAHCPGQHGVRSRRQCSCRVLDGACDPCCFQQLPRTVQFTLQPRLPVPGNGLAHLAQGPAGHILDIVDFSGRVRGFLLDQAPRQFALEGDQRQGVPKQVMQIARQTQPLLYHRQAGQLFTRRL